MAGWLPEQSIKMGEGQLVVAHALTHKLKIETAIAERKV